MNNEQAKDLIEVLHELSQNRKETANTVGSAMHDYTEELRFAQKLWKQKNSSWLIKAGLALVAFPDPTISDVVGAAMIAAGLVQLKMRNSKLYVEDVTKTFPRVVRELGSIKQGVV